MRSNLRAAGYEPSQIDTILLTHIHADHSGGLAVAGVRQFPNATVYVDKRDIEYFVTRQDTKDDSETLQRQVKQSRATVGPYLKAGKVVLINENGEVIAGITLLSEPGHTPGHTAYLVQSSGHELLVWGDIIHSSEVQFEHPEVTVSMTSIRVRPLEDVSGHSSSLLIRGFLWLPLTFPSPGLGHLRKVRAVYHCVSTPYNARVTELDPKP